MDAPGNDETMPLSYEAACCVWAAGRLGIEPALIESVEFSISYDGCDTCGYGQGCEAEGKYVDGRWFSLTVHDLGDAIKGVLAAALTASSPEEADRG